MKHFRAETRRLIHLLRLATESDRDDFWRIQKLSSFTYNRGPTIMFQPTEKLKCELFSRFILGCQAKKPISEFAFSKLASLWRRTTQAKNERA